MTRHASKRHGGIDRLGQSNSLDIGRLVDAEDLDVEPTRQRAAPQRLSRHEVVLHSGQRLTVMEPHTFRDELFAAVRDAGGAAALSQSRVLFQQDQTRNVYCLSDIAAVVIM